MKASDDAGRAPNPSKASVSIARIYMLAGPTVRLILTEEQFASLSPDVSVFFAMDEATFQRVMASANFGVMMELITGEGID